MASLGWGAGSVALFLSWFVSLQTFVFLVRLHEQGEAPNVRRMDRYPQLTREAFGARAGFWALTPFQLILFTGIPIAYTITGAESLQQCVTLLSPGSPWGGGAGGGLTRWVVLFSAVQLAVVQVPSFHSLSAVSLVGAAASLFYILVAFVGALVKGRAPGVAYGQPRAWTSPADKLFGVFNALATAAFAYGGHNIACEIQATLPLPPSTIKRMVGGGGGGGGGGGARARRAGPPSHHRPQLTSVRLTFLLTAWCYFSVAISGFWAYGAGVAPNILVSLDKPTGVIVAANLAVFLHVMGTRRRRRGDWGNG